MRIIERNIVAAVIFSKDSKLFQGMKDPAHGGVYADCWHIPGGGIEEQETAEQALIREILEETGIDISPYPVELIDNTDTASTEKTLRNTGEKVIVNMYFNAYKVTISDKNADEIQVRLDDDLVTYQWVSINELKNLKITPPSVRLFKKLGYI